MRVPLIAVVGWAFYGGSTFSCGSGALIIVFIVESAYRGRAPTLS